MSSFRLIRELRRRHVFRVAVAYAVVGWALIEVTATIIPALHLPDALTTAIVVLVLLGFPVAVVLAWAFEMTPGGVRRTESADSPAARATEQHRHVGRRLDLAIIGVLVVAVAALLWRQFAPHPASNAVAPLVAADHGAIAVADAAQADPGKSIAVLPFENLSADKDNEYFVAGMQDLILTKLADIGELKVISRTSTREYGSKPENLKLIARQLGVATVLEGSVQKAGNEVLINVQLIDARTDAHLWANTYQRTLDNIFGVEGEVAGKVADALKAKLSPDESAIVARIPTHDPQAYTLYLKAQYAWDQYHNVDNQSAHLLQASEFLKQAIAQDPKFALAYALLSRVQADLSMDAVEGKDASRQAKAIANARKALALQPNLAEAHFALAIAFIFGQSDQPDLAQALKEIQIAARLKPGDSEIATLLAGFQLAPTGDLRKMAAVVDKALRLDPRNAGNYRQSAGLKMVLREYDGARQTLEHGLAIHPEDQRMRGQMAWLMVLTGDPAKARVQLAQMPANAQGAPGALVWSWLYSGDYAKALQVAEQAPQSQEFGYAGDIQLSIGVAAQLSGETVRAKAALDQARIAINKTLLEHPKSTNLRLRLARVDMWSDQRAAALQLVDKILQEGEVRLRQINESLRQAEGSRSQGPGLSLMSEYAYAYELRAEILAHFGDAKNATELLDRLMATQGTGDQISPALLRFDPTWNPIRKDPRFQALLTKYPSDAPAQTMR